MQHINSALRAHVLFHKDDNYIVDGDEVVIVDEFTGRTMHYKSPEIQPPQYPLYPSYPRACCRV
jgi:hypothetical protein